MTINAVLMCGRCGHPTLHIFAERRVRRPEPHDSTCVDFIYECDACGARRPWGNEPVENTRHGRLLGEAGFAHLVDAHGMRRHECPDCRSVGLDCSMCEDEGFLLAFESLDPCGPTCPFGRGEREGTC